jgi:hypothetical protein
MCSIARLLLNLPLPGRPPYLLLTDGHDCSVLCSIARLLLNLPLPGWPHYLLLTATHVLSAQALMNTTTEYGCHYQCHRSAKEHTQQRAGKATTELRGWESAQGTSATPYCSCHMSAVHAHQLAHDAVVVHVSCTSAALNLTTRPWQRRKRATSSFSACSSFIITSTVCWQRWKMHAADAGAATPEVSSVHGILHWAAAYRYCIACCPLGTLVVVT